jgi:hypothetical protein
LLGIKSRKYSCIQAVNELQGIPNGILALHSRTPFGFDVSFTIIPMINVQNTLLVDQHTLADIIFMSDNKLSGCHKLKDFKGNDFVIGKIEGVPHGSLFMHKIVSSCFKNRLWIPNGFQGLCMPDFLPIVDNHRRGWEVLKSLRNLYIQHEQELLKSGLNVIYLRSHVRWSRISPWLISSSKTKCCIFWVFYVLN